MYRIDFHMCNESSSTCNETTLYRNDREPANFYVKLLMSSTQAAVNSFDECNVFEKAAQLSVIVYDNKLNDSNDEAFSIQSVTVALDTTNYFNRPRTHGIRVCDREPSRIPKKRIPRILKKSRKVRRLLRTYIRKSIPKSSWMHLFTNKTHEKNICTWNQMWKLRNNEVSLFCS